MNCKNYSFIISGAIIISLLTGCRQLLEGPNDPGFIQTDLEPVEKIVVSSPVKGDIYEPGESVQINWITSNSSISYIDIYLYRKSVLKRTLANSLVNQGSYTWHIPHVIDYSNHYTVKIVNSNNPEVFNYSGQFGILKNN
jgi:hypothetical protein